ncbi:MAG: metallo-mystery pair system four-Cys motif protein [Myxococcales bacterium 68-20]|nr:MAG: metallo-mystery pair system four-Cys motif protein [Myxococcales bacterium 68-20]
MRTSHCIVLLLAATASFSLFACGDDDSGASRGTPDGGAFDASVTPDASDTDGGATVDSGGAGETTIRFKASDGDGKEWKCGSSNLRVGNLTDVRPGDLRLYVYDVALLAADGSPVPFQLADDGKWQHQGVALLDFEDATAECAFVIFGKAKSADTNTVLRGTPAAAGPFRGVRFKIGVPPSLNHTDTAVAPSPLSLTGMDHGIADGRQFLRASFYSSTTGATGNSDHNLIMLRTVCNNATGDGGAPPADEETCTKPNRPLITVEREGGFDPAQHEVVVDVTNLFAGYSDLGTAGPADLNDSGRIDCFGPLHAGNLGPTLGAERCGKFYPNLGLAYDTGRPSGTQTVFRAP